MKRIFAFLMVAVIAGVGGWFAARNTPISASKADASSGPKVLFYQSSMHPWIKSEKPGDCTICGMKLSPVYEGQKGYEMEAGMVRLSSNSITVLNVATAPVTNAPLRRSLRLAGTIVEDETKRRIISAFVPGRIEKLNVNFIGAEVEAGAPLATIFSPELLTAEREFAALTNRNAAGDLLDLAKLRLRRLGVTDAQIQSLAKKDPNAAESEIVAPLAGTIVNRFVYPGQYVMEGEKLFEVADLSTMWLQVSVYERDLALVRVGQMVRVTIPSLPGQHFEGKIAFINPNLDDMTRSAVARIELENPLIDDNGVKRRPLFNKLYAEAEVAVETAPLLTVRRSAVLNPGGEPIVYVDLGGGGYERRPVKLGRRGDDSWEVLEGLEADEQVVIEGNLLIDSQAQLEHSRDNASTAPAPAAHEHSAEGHSPEAAAPSIPTETAAPKGGEGL